jgi:hypothetical protein
VHQLHRDVLVDRLRAEQHDEWAEGRRYLALDVLARSRMTLITGDNNQEDPIALTA